MQLQYKLNSYKEKLNFYVELRQTNSAKYSCNFIGLFQLITFEFEIKFVKLRSLTRNNSVVSIILYETGLNPRKCQTVN